ncbi:MAG: hypothetical protein ABI679_08320 [Gemmatimonadota bacterium]
MIFQFLRRNAPLGLVPGAVLLLLSCSDGTGPIAANGPSMAFGTWVPGPGDTCSSETHDRFSVVGPDGKLYPTWHPPTDPATGCTFGHEHGRDPRGSHLYGRTGPIPFGYANEVLDAWDPGRMRHEDHVGHKIEWENDVVFRIEDGVSSRLLQVTCDVMTKLHQGTHSKDAFTNNLHELVYHIRCTDRTELDITVMDAIGTPGEFTISCGNNSHVTVGPATPANSPNGGGQRVIPDRSCIDAFLLQPPGTSSDFNAVRESWQTSVGIQKDNGDNIAFINPYFQVLFPSRFYDPSLAGGLGRIMDTCYETESNGDIAQGGACAQSTNNGQLPGLAFDDPRVVFNGSRRFVDINSNHIDNANGAEVWYTDPFGRHGATRPFPGSIRQFVASVRNDYGFDVSGPSMGGNRNYGGNGVHAPN